MACDPATNCTIGTIAYGFVTVIRLNSLFRNLTSGQPACKLDENWFYTGCRLGSVCVPRCGPRAGFQVLAGRQRSESQRRSTPAGDRRAPVDAMRRAAQGQEN